MHLTLSKALEVGCILGIQFQGYLDYKSKSFACFIIINWRVLTLCWCSCLFHPKNLLLAFPNCIMDTNCDCYDFHCQLSLTLAHSPEKTITYLFVGKWVVVFVDDKCVYCLFWRRRGNTIPFIQNEQFRFYKHLEYSYPSLEGVHYRDASCTKDSKIWLFVWIFLAYVFTKISGTFTFLFWIKDTYTFVPKFTKYKAYSWPMPLLQVSPLTQWIFNVLLCLFGYDAWVEADEMARLCKWWRRSEAHSQDKPELGIQ